MSGMNRGLSARMLDAAETIAELNIRYDLGAYCPWEPETLRREAQVVADEERERAR